MTPFLALAAALGAASAFAAPPVAYEGSHQGVATRVELQIDGSRFEATLSEPAMQLGLRGSVQGRQLQGQLIEPGSGQALMPMKAELLGDELLLELQPPAMAPARMALRRVAATGTGDAASSSGSIDPQIVGRWRRDSMINSPGGAGGFASFSTVRTLELGPDGRARQTVRSVGGGSHWSSDGGERTEFSGRWQARQGEIWVLPDGQAQFVNAGRYRRVGAHLVTENGQGRQVWSR